MVKRIHTDGFVIKDNYEIEIKKKGKCIIKNCNNVKWANSE